MRRGRFCGKMSVSRGEIANVSDISKALKHNFNS